ncbi:MAG TPA: polyphosphate polymerase domain-containing protein [Desulfitobacterium dehalogenans]|uniref:Polyphosphate polymerase domain-containing protein n=1 Tax=Desulfitobacterium dehalogenans TaxID=36854 RepID=A0A7C7DAD3_9FIRM|nr:polyphosphate polymerase domain-containing protein [Desulfitobacterium dehalogenans]
MSKYRHEIKMGINEFDKRVLASRLSCIMQRDKHGEEDGSYKVRSLYFDDLSDTAFHDKLMGVKYREKFRIRTYGDSSLIRLEKKVKDNQLGYKETARLTREECERLLEGEYHFLRERSERVCRQLYIKLRTGLFSPKTIVEYDREAYIWEPGRIRITFDSNVRTGLGSVDFFNTSLPLVPAGYGNTVILEIKYDEYLPRHISQLLQLDSRHKSAISKYALCRRYG